MSRRNTYFIPQTLTTRTMAFLAATGIFDATITSALNSMDLSLISNGLDAKIQAIYPFVGGTSTTCKYNFMNALDTDAAFRLSFSGGWGFASTGATPNGINAFANSFYKPATNASINSISFGHYSRTDYVTTYAPQVHGTYDAGAGTALVQQDVASGEFYIGDYGSGALSYTATPILKFMMVRRSSDSFMEAYRDGVSLGTKTNTETQIANLDFYWGARNNNGSPFYYTNNEIAFAFIGNGTFSNADALNLTTIVNNFQTALSRNV